jgi:SAM-dependent methyltransferase
MNERAAPDSGPETMPIEEDGWWAHARRRLLVEEINRHVPAHAQHLDVGCGRATVAAALAEAGRHVVAVDAHQFTDWQGLNRVRFVLASADRLPFRDGAFASTSAFDVIEHLDDDAAALAEVRRVTTNRGSAWVTVPAFSALWGTHDERVGHRRRYTRSSLATRLRSSGLTPVWSTYFFSFLVPPAWIFRRQPSRVTADRGRFASLATPLIEALCAAERRIVRYRRLPWGTSLLTVAHPDSKHAARQAELKVGVGSL